MWFLKGSRSCSIKDWSENHTFQPHFCYTLSMTAATGNTELAPANCLQLHLSCTKETPSCLCRHLLPGGLCSVQATKSNHREPGLVFKDHRTSTASALVSDSRQGLLLQQRGVGEGLNRLRQFCAHTAPSTAKRYRAPLQSTFIAWPANGSSGTGILGPRDAVVRKEKKGEGVCEREYCGKEKKDLQLKQEQVRSRVRSVRIHTMLSTRLKREKSWGQRGVFWAKNRFPKEKSGFKRRGKKRCGQTK